MSEERAETEQEHLKYDRLSFYVRQYNIAYSVLDEVWESAWQAGKRAGNRELLGMVQAYRPHHKLMLQVTDDCDCPCLICKQAEALLSLQAKEGE